MCLFAGLQLMTACLQLGMMAGNSCDAGSHAGRVTEDFTFRRAKR
jgi:hypothetical protein